jgi:hypothetical protein
MEEGSVDTDSETTDTVDIVFTSRSNTPEGPVEVLEIRDPSAGNDEQFEVMVIEEDADNNDGENFEDETDPTVLLAVMDSMNTPLSDRYMDEFYDNINDIQDVCEADFQTYCNEGDATVTTMPSKFDFSRYNLRPNGHCDYEEYTIVYKSELFTFRF